MTVRGAAGVYAFTAEEYHADVIDEQPSLSSSIAHLLWEKSPRHAWTAHPRLNPEFKRTEQSSFDIGTAAHAMLVERKPAEDVVEIVYFPDWRTNAAKEAREEARAVGKIALLEHQMDDVFAMTAATVAQLERIEVEPGLFLDGKPEQTLVWQDGGVPCRARLDWLRDDYATIDDFKTTAGSASHTFWPRTLFTIGADVQAAFYVRGCRELFGFTPTMRYVVQEIYPPYALSVFELAPAVLDVATAKVQYAIRAWRRCIENDEWPAYRPRVATVELPPWEDTRAAEKLQIEELAA